MKTFSAEHFHRVERILAMIDDGTASEHIAAAFGLSLQMIEKYRNPKSRVRRHHDRRRRIRADYLTGMTRTRLSRRYKSDWRYIASLVSDLPAPESNDTRPPGQFTREDPVMNTMRQVIVEVVGNDGNPQFLLVQPTGHLLFTSSMAHPEKQWMFEAVDSRDGYRKLYAMTDIRQWILPDPTGLRQSGLADNSFACTV